MATPSVHSPKLTDNRRFYVAVFVFFTLAFGAFFLYTTPPYMGADERNHVNRAWAISTGEFFPSTEGNRRGGQSPVALLSMKDPFWGLRFNYVDRTSWETINDYAGRPLEPERTQFYDYPNTAVYPWPVYAPAAVGLAAARSLDASLLTTLRLARWAGLLTWLLAGALALWWLPAWRSLFTALLLLPMTVWTHAMVSADTMTNSVAFLTLAYLLRLAFAPALTVTPRRLLIIVLLAITLATTKLVYTPILLLALLIPANRFRTYGGKWLAAVLVAGAALLTLTYWTHQSSQIYLPFADYAPEFRAADIGLTADANVPVHRDMIVKAPYRLFRAAGNGLVDVFGFYTFGYIGILGWIDTFLPESVYYLAYAFLFLLAFTEQKTTWTGKAVFLLTVAACYLLVVLSQLLSWEPVGAHVVKALMGRYFIPFAPLIFLLFAGIDWRPKGRRWVLAVGSVALLTVSAWSLCARYYIPLE